MGNITPAAPVHPLLAVITRYDEALAWTRQTVTGAWGEIALVSPTFEFRDTRYYEATMGPELTKTFLVFRRRRDPAELPAWKHATAQWEQDYAALARHAEPRPLNLDPGYLTCAKLVLASTKDHAHRIYLADGIYAEVTLYYRDRHWQSRDWTFPDYRRADYHRFFDQVRRALRSGELCGEQPPASNS